MLIVGFKDFYTTGNELIVLEALSLICSDLAYVFCIFKCRCYACCSPVIHEVSCLSIEGILEGIPTERIHCIKNLSFWICSFLCQMLKCSEMQILSSFANYSKDT